jgi:uncharacterized RDD family membrane protein YckC
MTSPAESPESGGALQAAAVENVRHVGLITRAVSWGVDALVINGVAILAGLGVELVVSIFPITQHLKPLFAVIAGAVYVLWAATYFVVFWSMTGQTPGARVMQVRLVTPSGGRVKPVRAVVRFVGMNVAMVPLPWGFVPIPFDRLGFPDWLAHTRVIEAQQLSVAEARRGRLRQVRDGSRRSRSRSTSEASDSRDTRVPPEVATLAAEPASAESGTGSK